MAGLSIGLKWGIYMKIEILMSTYNGQKYIREQIDSIINQEGVEVCLSIRDDGSSDDTVNIIKSYIKEYPEKIRLFEGCNIGYKRSFIKILSLAESSASYYAFSDQDDVWKSNKCIAALSKIHEGYDLYVSSVENCNEKLEAHTKNDLSSGIQSLKSDFTRHRFPGCTMVFSEKIRKKALQVTKGIDDITKMPSHDLIVSTVSYCCGDVFVDCESYVLHRRTDKSLTGRGYGIINRIKTEWYFLLKTENERYYMACMLLKGLSLDENSEDFLFLKKIVDYKKSFLNRIKLIFEKDFTSGILICDIETRLKILLNKF